MILISFIQFTDLERKCLCRHELPVDFARVQSLFLGHSDNVFNKRNLFNRRKSITYSKIKRAQHNSEKPQHNSEKIIFKYSSFVLSVAKKTLLWKSSKFNIPPKKLNHADCLVNFETFYRDICNLEVLSTEDLDLIKTKVRDVALSSFRTYNNNIPQHLSKGEFNTNKSSFKNLKSDNSPGNKTSWWNVAKTLLTLLTLSKYLFAE